MGRRTGRLRRCGWFGALPPTCQVYVRRLESLIGCRISGIGVGPSREESIALHPLL